MGVFDYAEQTQRSQEGPKPVSVVDSGGNGYSQLRITIPSAFVDDLGLEAGDTLMVSERDGELVISAPDL